MKKAIGVEAEKAKEEGKTLMVEDKDYVWTLYSCKNKCNQNKECSAFSFDGTTCFMVLPKPPPEVKKINFDETFEQSREGICDIQYKQEGDG